MNMLYAVLVILLLIPGPAMSFMSEEEIATLQRETSGLTTGQRIAFWAEQFLGTPYDPDPLGEYVTREVIVADDRVDCMYLTFRSAELALSGTPEEAVEVALDKRFMGSGVMKEGKVLNYDNRFQYAQDMLSSGKWGREITGTLGETVEIEGSRGTKTVRILPGAQIPGAVPLLESGDIIFFVKDPAKRVVGEIVGHIGIIKREGDKAFLIHAGGKKDLGGVVKKVLLTDYARSMPFVGIRVSRF
jgi:hypothetical protein